jgi:phosphatidylinositol alpha-mannosyltransferase
VLGLAAALRTHGHTVRVLAPAEGPVPEFVTPVGRAVGVPYNGSVARVAFGPVAYARVRRWLVGHRFDVLHLHEPTTASVSAIALLLAEGPVVATFHTATERSRALAALGGIIAPLMEKVTARIAVSPSARRVQVRHLGGDAVEIPNGVDLAARRPVRGRATPVAFVGRFDEPRGHAGAARRAGPAGRPDLRLVVVGRGDGAGLPRGSMCSAPSTTPRKAAVLGAATVFCAPQTGGELRMVLTGLWPRCAGAGGRPRRLPGGARRPPRGRCSGRGTRRRYRGARCAVERPGAAGRAPRPPGARGRRSSTGRWWRRHVERVYRAAVAADPRQWAS